MATPFLSRPIHDIFCPCQVLFSPTTLSVNLLDMIPDHTFFNLPDENGGINVMLLNYTNLIG